MNEAISTPSKESLALKFHNEVQILLADEFYGVVSGEARLKWIQAYSKKFRDIVTAYPELLASVKKDDPVTLEPIKELLYHTEVA